MKCTHTIMNCWCNVAIIWERSILARNGIPIFPRFCHYTLCSGITDKIQPYRIEIVVAGTNLKMAYSYILEKFHFYISNLDITSNFFDAL